MTKQELQKAISDALGKLVTLEIVTVVGTYDTTARLPGAGAKMMRTRLNLLQGDKVTEIDEAFVTGPLAGLRDYHAQTEAAGHEIIKANLAALEKLLELVEKLA
jgi:hypothetical protein